MNNRERQDLDRHITGNYGKDQFKNEEAPVGPSPAPWIVNPDYGNENVYRLWDKDANYHEDTSPEAMDANCLLIAAAPEMYEALKDVVSYFWTPGRPALSEGDVQDLVTKAIAKAEGR